MPTYWPTDRRKVPDIIDFGIVKEISKANFNITNSLDLSSDHSPLIIEVRKLTIYHCEKCTEKPGLCPGECFSIYHNK